MQYLRQKSDGRYYWEPSAALRRVGFRPFRLPDDRAAAEAEARQHNARVDAWRGAGADSEAVPARPTGDSVAAMIAAYQQSRFWQRLAPKTRIDYASSLRVIEAWAGPQPARAISEPMVQHFYEALIETGKHARANAVLRVLRLLFAFGVRFGHCDRNPAQRPGMVAAERVTPVVLWSPAMVRAFAAAADAMGRHSVGTAVVVNEWLGQREGDVLALPRDFGARTLVEQSKTGARVDLPIGDLQRLQARVEAERARHAQHAARPIVGATLILSESTGRPYTADNFRHVFRRVAGVAAAGEPALGIPPTPELAGVRFCWLRHTAVTRMAEAGCELAEISAVSGHTIKSAAQIIEHYLVRTGRMARAAFRKRLALAEAAIGETLVPDDDSAEASR